MTRAVTKSARDRARAVAQTASTDFRTRAPSPTLRIALATNGSSATPRRATVRRGAVRDANVTPNASGKRAKTLRLVNSWFPLGRPDRLRSTASSSGAPRGTTEPELRHAIAVAGADVGTIAFILDRVTGVQRGFAFVDLLVRMHTSTDSVAIGRLRSARATVKPWSSEGSPIDVCAGSPNLINYRRLPNFRRSTRGVDAGRSADPLRIARARKTRRRNTRHGATLALSGPICRAAWTRS
jgi:hypothetical protein